jgi:hypothetical protein
MYRLDGDDSANIGLLLAPALASGMRSAPVEQVRFLRDEMANMVWAVEYRVASKLGEPFNPALAPPVPPPGPAATAARFHLGDSVPANWRPFIPAHLPGSQRSIRLQRARLPDQPALPLGVVLDAPAPYFVAEEGSARRAACHARLPPRSLDRRCDISLDGTRIAGRSRRGFERLGI